MASPTHTSFSRTIFILLCMLCTLTRPLAAGTDLDLFFNADDRYADVIVTKVTSADTIEINDTETIRLIGIRAPDAPRRKSTTERDDEGFVIEPAVSAETPIEEQAFSYTIALLTNAHVRIEFDALKKDDENNTWGYVFLIDSNTFINEEILKNGFAHLQISPPNTKYADRLRAAYREARAEKRGLYIDY